MTETVQESPAAAATVDANDQPGTESAPVKVEPIDPEFASDIENVQKKFNKLTEHRRSAERRAQETERKADEAAREAQYWREQALRAQQPKELVREAESQVKTLADFEYDDAKYQSYVLEQAEKRAVAAAEKRLKDQGETDARERRKATFVQRETEFAKTAADYREKTRSASFPVSDAMAEVFAESEEGPAVAYYLANNLNLADSIARMQPLAAARELGRIEAKLISEREKAAKTVSNAPPPPPKIDGAGDPKVDKDPKDMTDVEFAKWRRKQIAQRK